MNPDVETHKVTQVDLWLPQNRPSWLQNLVVVVLIKDPFFMVMVQPSWVWPLWTFKPHFYISQLPRNPGGCHFVSSQLMRYSSAHPWSWQSSNSKVPISSITWMTGFLQPLQCRVWLLPRICCSDFPSTLNNCQSHQGSVGASSVDYLQSMHSVLSCFPACWWDWKKTALQIYSNTVLAAVWLWTMGVLIHILHSPTMNSQCTIELPC